MALVFTSLASSAGAHEAWVAQRTDALTIVYGHLAEDGACETRKVKPVEGITATGERKPGDDLPALLQGKPYADAAMINDYPNNAGAASKAEGKAVLKVTSAGLNVLAAEHPQMTPDNADVDEPYLLSSLSFALPHVE
jgi:hypothetical protein